MEVLKKIKDPNKNNHTIEWGNATWTENEELADKQKSIRNRYDKDDGGFNYAGSSEIPWTDFNLMILESITNGEFSKAELYDIFTEILKYKV